MKTTQSVMDNMRKASQTNQRSIGSNAKCSIYSFVLGFVVRELFG